jgi:hypothetical protein
MRYIKKKIRAGPTLTAHKKDYKSTISGGPSKSPDYRMGSEVISLMCTVPVGTRSKKEGFLPDLI